MNTSEIQVGFVTKSFKQSYQSNKGSISKIFYENNQSLLYVSSLDGVLAVWNIVTQYNYKYLREYTFVNDSCRDFVLLQNKILAIVLQKSIVIFDISNENQKLIITQSDQSFIQQYSLYTNQKYILAYLDSCLRVIDINLKLLINKCQLQDVINAVISSQSIIYIQGQKFINVYSLDLTNQELVQQNQGITNAKNIQNFYLDENQPSGIQIVYFDFSIQKLFITDDQFNSIIQVQLNQVQQLITVKSFKDLNQQLWYFIVYKTNNYFVAAINQQSQIITKIYNMTSILGIYQIDCNINYNGQLIFYLTIASNSLSTPFLSTIKWNSYKNVGIIQQFLYNTEGSQITFVDQINQNNGLISVGSQNGFTGLNHDINFQNNYIYQIDQSDNNLIQQVSLSYQLNRIFIIKKTIIEYDLVLNSYIGEMKFDEPNLNQIEQIQGFQIQNDLRIILLFKSYQFIIKSYQNDIPQIYKLNNFGVIQNYYLNVSQKYLYVYGTKLSRFNLQLLEELVIISFLQYNKLIYQCIFPTGLIVCKYGDFSLVFLNSQDYSILKNFDVSGIEIGFNLTFDQQNNKLYLYKQSILTYTLAGQYLFSMNQQKQPIIEFKFCSDKIAILTAGNGYFYDRVSQTFLANFLSNQVGVFQKSIYIPNYNQLLFYSDYVQVGQISIFDLTQLILRGFLQLTFNTMVQIADFFFDESTQMLIIVNYQGNILAFNFQQSMNYNVLTIDDFENNHPIGFCVDYITNSLIVYNNNKVILINYALIAQKMQRNVDPIQFQTITKIDQFNNKKYILVDSTNIIYSYQNYTFSYQSYFQDQIKGIYQTQDQSVTLIYFLNYFIVYLNSNFDQIYFSNNNSYIVNGYRIYKFITDFIFLTIDNQVVHYDYLNNLVIFTFNIPFPQIIKSQLIQSDLILLGTSQGTIISYMISKKSMFTINLQSQYPIISILYTSSNYWFAQIDGSLNIYLTSGFNVLSQPIFNINIIDIIQSNQNTKLKAQLNLIILDEPQNRYFVQLSNSKVCIVIDMSTNLIIRNLMFPTDQISKIKITQNYVILLSTSQLNIHKRQDLIFQYQLKCNNVLDQIIDLIILYDQIYIISFTDKLQIYYFYQDILNFKLVDSMKLKFPIILNYNYDLVSTLLSIIGFSNQNIFEKKYWIKSFITNSPKCSSVVNGFTNVDVLKNINVLQAGNIILQQQQLLYLNLFDFTPVNFINQAQVSIILKPYDQLSSFNVNTQTFQSIQKDAYLKNFQLQFVEQGLFQFSNQTNKVFLQNISIKSQKISKIQIQFSKQSVVVIQNLIISDINDQVRLRLQTEKDSQNHNLTYRNLQQQNFSSFLAFQDCQTVIIYDLQISNAIIKNIQQLIFFSGITNIYIKNLTVTQSQFQVMAKFQNIQNLTIENMFIKDNKAQQLQFQNPNQILQISGSLNTQISNLQSINCSDYQILNIVNSYQQGNQLIQLKNDEVNLNSIYSANNSLSYIDKNQNFNQYFFQISNLKIDNFTQLNNQMNIQIFSSDSVSIINSKFQNNTSLLGGSISFIQIYNQIIINNSIFQYNIARASGGAIYAENIAQIIIQKNSKIINNQALIGGGIRVIGQDVILNITSDTVSQNNANIFGNNIGTYPVDIDITSDDKKENLIFTKTKNELVRYGVVEIFNYQSGSSTNFLISYIDSENRKIDFTPESVNNKMYPQIIIDEITSWLFQLESQDATLIQLTGQQQINYNQFDSINRCFRLENVYINANPNSNQQINLIYFISKYQQKNTIQLNIQLRQCIQGEIYKQFSKQIQICQSCVGGYYSIQVPQENQTSECQKCPNEAVTCDKNKLILKQGYWREQQIGQLNILLCDTLNNSCDESNLQNKYGCLQGYIGPLCEQCDYSGLIWGEKYSAYGYQKKCYSCSSNQTQIIVLTLSFLGLFFYITIQVYTFMKNFEVYLIQQYLRLSNILPISASQIGKLNSFYIKCLLNYIQLHQIIVDFELQWLPQSIFYISDFFGKPNSHIIVNLICIIPSYIINNNGVGSKSYISTDLLYECQNEKYKIYQYYFALYLTSLKKANPFINPNMVRIEQYSYITLITTFQNWKKVSKNINSLINQRAVDIVEKIGAEDLQITIDQNEQTMKLLKMNQEITSQLSQNAANSQNCIVFSPKKVKSFLNQFDNFNKQISIKQENDQDVKAIQTNQKDLILEISLQESKLDQINNEIQEHDGNKKNQINMQFNQMEFQKMENLVKNKITQS
ncbi:hypothetical protein ABPG73_003632 [Tetrahymena malaccensis]